MKEIEAKFAEVLKEGRRNREFTLRQLAQLAGCSPSYISEMENGVRLPPKSEKAIKKLAKLLKIDPEVLIQLSQAERIRPERSPEIVKILRKKGGVILDLLREAEDADSGDIQQTINHLRELKAVM